MGNTLITNYHDVLPIMGARLENQLQFIRMLPKRYNDKFGQDGKKVGDTCYEKLPVRFTGGTGLSISGKIENIVEKEFPIKIEENLHVAYQASDWEYGLTIESFFAKYSYLDSAIRNIAVRADRAMLLKAYLGTPAQYGTYGTAINTADLIAQIKEKAMSMAIPSPFHMIVNEKVEREMWTGLVGQYAPQDKLSANYIKGQMSDGQFGFEKIVSSQNVYKHTSGTMTTVNIDGANQGGDGTITIAALSGTIKKGDILKFAAIYSVNPETKQTTGNLMQVVATADVADSGTEISFSPDLVESGAYQNCTALPATGSAIVIDNSCASGTPIVNLMFNPEAFAFVTVDLPMPKVSSVEESNSITTESGIRISHIKFFDPVERMRVDRFDLAYGANVLPADMGVMALRVVR